MLKISAGQVEAVEVKSTSLLISKDVEYAQKATWGIEEASGFIQLFGQSTSTWASVKLNQGSVL